MGNWQDIDTVLLDMDGTVLDLAYDNYFWRELIPRVAARRHAESLAEARARIYALFDSRRGSLDWYCLDFWSQALDLELRSLKAACSHRVAYLPGVRPFLEAVCASRRRLILVTNAHGDTLEIKRGLTGLDRYFEQLVSSHQLGFAKEQMEFWPALQAQLEFDPERTAFIDDSLPVLNAARQFGVAMPVAIRCPDMRRPAQDTGDHQSIDGLSDLVAMASQAD